MARRPKYQLVASILYLINFTLRKIDRRSELFAEADKQVGAIESDIEKDYDQILDIMFSSITGNYGEYGDEYNFALDMV